MATKAEIKAKIQSIFTLNTGLTDWDEVEECLIDEVDSILENGYPDPIVENSSSTHVITTPNSDFSYNATFTKSFGRIHISGSFTSNITASSQQTVITVLDIDLTEYDSGASYFGLAYNISNGNMVQLEMSAANKLGIGGSVVSGETYTFSLTYNALS